MASCHERDRMMSEWRRLIVSGQPSEFFTVTTGLSVSPHVLERRVKHWLNRANRSLFGRRWFKQGGNELHTCTVIETGKLGRVHAHVLLGHRDRVLTPKEIAWIKAIWTLGRVDHRAVDNLEGVAGYVIKAISSGSTPILSRRYQSHG